MHVPFRLPLPKAVAVGSASPHGRLQEGQSVQSWAAVQDSWMAAGRTNCNIRKILCAHFTPNKTYIAKFTNEQYATIKQSMQDISTRGSLSTAYTCKQLTKTLGSKRPAVD